MEHRFDLKTVEVLQGRLNGHPVYGEVDSLEKLQIFMQHHVFSVWDFMSLLKYLQAHIAPAAYPWIPKGTGVSRRFVNSLVLEEESDLSAPGPEGAEKFDSHFELYLKAMREVGADNTVVAEFIRLVSAKGVEIVLKGDFAPEPSRNFMKTTFSFVDSGKPHVVAAAFALGREKIIPEMFRALIKKMKISQARAPIFHFYLERHIHLDEDFHFPFAISLLNELCENDPNKVKEAEDAAKKAIEARITFWDGVLAALKPAMSGVNG